MRPSELEGDTVAARLVVRCSAAAAAGIAVLASAGTAVAAPATVSANPSPYAAPGCLALDASQVADAGSLNYLNSEVEPQVAIDPTDSMHLVAVWQQDRWSDGGAHGLVAGYSTNGGASWHVSPQPFSACYHASGFPGDYLDYQRASDAWVSIGPGTPESSSGSTAYSVSLSFDQTPYPGDPNARRNAVGAAVSYDGGATWTNVQPIIADPCEVGSVPAPGYVCNNPRSYVFNDKESVTADPVHPGVAYAVWDRLVAPPASPQGFQHELAYFGQTLLAKTTDYGRTWSQPRIIVGLASQDQTLGNQIVIDPRTGVLYNFFDLIQNRSNRQQHRGENVAFVSSADGGATWTAPKVISSLQAGVVVDPANVDPDTNTPPAPSRTGDDIPEPAIDPATGQLYVVWQDSRFAGNGGSAVVLSTSSDGGATWSAPAQVNISNGRPAYDPAVYVAPDSHVGVTYLQWGTTVAGNEPTTLFIRHSVTPGSSTAAPTWDGPTPLSGPFNNLAAPDSRGYFLGDYQGLVANGSGFIPVYVETNCADGGPTTEPSCRAITSVLSPADPTPTRRNSTDVSAFPGS
jgi:hypothetical protein